MSNILPYQMKNVVKHCVCSFDAASPGMVFAKTNCDTQEEKFYLLGDSQLPTRAPAAISPPGMPALPTQKHLSLREGLLEGCAVHVPVPP